MTTPRLIAIGFICFVSAIAWFILGASVTGRSGAFDSQLTSEVSRLWGGVQRQAAPSVAVNRPVEVTETVQEPQPSGAPITRKIKKTITQSTPIPLDSSRVSVDLRLQHRQKGLLWYDTYTVTFEGKYVVHNPDAIPRVIVARLKFPSADAPYDQFTLRLNGIEAPPVSNLSEVEVRALLPAGAEAPLEIRYSSRGLDQWVYAFTESGVTQVHDLALTMTTDFPDVDFPPDYGPRDDDGTEARVAVWKPRDRPGDRAGPSREDQPGPARCPHHVLRSGLTVVLHDGAGHPRHPER
jgi:hypothetical protein